MQYSWFLIPQVKKENVFIFSCKILFKLLSEEQDTGFSFLKEMFGVPVEYTGKLVN